MTTTITDTETPKQLEINGQLVFRNVLEQCKIMINNDEIVTYGMEIKHDEDLPAKLVFSRPVFVQENLRETIQAFFASSKPIAKLDERPSELTVFLDGFYHLKVAYKRYLQYQTQIFGKTAEPSKFLAEYLATNYYDCLSGGMPTGAFHIVAALCRDPRIERSTQVYPNGNQWSTLTNFIEEASKSKTPTATTEVLKITQGLDGLLS